MRSSPFHRIRSHAKTQLSASPETHSRSLFHPSSDTKGYGPLLPAQTPVSYLLCLLESAAKKPHRFVHGSLQSRLAAPYRWSPQNARYCLLPSLLPRSVWRLRPFPVRLLHISKHLFSSLYTPNLPESPRPDRSVRKGCNRYTDCCQSLLFRPLSQSPGSRSHECICHTGYTSQRLLLS